jgi:hypothetical protein
MTLQIREKALSVYSVCFRSLGGGPYLSVPVQLCEPLALLAPVSLEASCCPRPTQEGEKLRTGRPPRNKAIGPSLQGDGLALTPARQASSFLINCFVCLIQCWHKVDSIRVCGLLPAQVCDKPGIGRSKATLFFQPQFPHLLSGSQWYRACLACLRPWVPSQHCKINKYIK